MFFSDSLKKLKGLFGAESSDGLQEQLASLRLAVGQSEETICSLRAELLDVREELRAAKQELAAEKVHARLRKPPLQTKGAPMRP